MKTNTFTNRKKSGRSKRAGSLIAIALISFSATYYTPSAEATIPNIDIPAAAQRAFNSLQRTIEAAKEQALIQQGITFAGKLASMATDNMNNIGANIIGRAGLATQETQNIEQAERAMPAQDACATVEFSFDIGEAACSTFSEMKKTVSDRQGANLAAMGMAKPSCNVETGECTFFKGVAPGLEDINALNTIEVEKVIDRCDELLDSSGVSHCANPSLLIAAPDGALTDDEYEALSLQLKILAGVEKEMPAANKSYGSPDTPQYKRARAKDMKRTLTKEGAHLNQKLLQTTFHGVPNEGDKRTKGSLLALEEYLSKRLGSQDWICEATNTCLIRDSTSPYVSPDELKRRSIQMDAVLLHIQFEQYKSSLRTEKLLSDLVLIEMKK